MYFAHSENPRGEWNPLRKHLSDVARKAEELAAAFGRGPEARLAGLVHDLGKYGDLFQARLRGEERGLDHWSAGASVCLAQFHHPQAALAVQGHHVGIQWWDKSEFRKLLPDQLEANPPAERRLTAPLAELLGRFHSEGLALPEATPSLPDDTPTSTMLDVRMLLSALADADYLETERHFDPEATDLRGEAAPLAAELASATVDRHIEEVVAGADCSSEMSEIRRDLLAACRAAAEQLSGLFTLTAPTGTGKTLSTLSFALRHARRNGLRRIVIVLPYLSIIEQTARVYRKALGQPTDRYLLEHHSLAIGTPEAEDNSGRLRGVLRKIGMRP